ncbi:MAG: hypothetical protein V7459_09780 [Oceanicoccus sp.]
MSLSILGIFHTILGLSAIFVAVYILCKDKQFGLTGWLNKFYLAATVFTAASALGIYKHGEFNGAHGLAVLTILAVLVGIIATKLDFLGDFKRYFVALCFSSTMLFHLLPTATEILTRFPMDAPMAGSLQAPLLLNTFAVILLCFSILLTLQLNWLRKSSNT